MEWRQSVWKCTSLPTSMNLHEQLGRPWKVNAGWPAKNFTSQTTNRPTCGRNFHLQAASCPSLSVMQDDSDKRSYEMATFAVPSCKFSKKTRVDRIHSSTSLHVLSTPKDRSVTAAGIISLETFCSQPLWHGCLSERNPFCSSGAYWPKQALRFPRIYILQHGLLKAVSLIELGPFALFLGRKVILETPRWWLLCLSLNPVSSNSQTKNQIATQKFDKFPELSVSACSCF